MWCIVVCDLGNLKNEEAMTRVGSQRHRKRKRKRNVGGISDRAKKRTWKILIKKNL
jgi:hypothetical protein